MKTIQKKAYQEPCMTVLRTAPIQMLAGSDPQVHTTTNKVSTDYDALVKEDKSGNFWYDDWSE
jgi:hypothetical protein